MNLLNVQGDEPPKTFECFFIDGLKSAVRNAPTTSGICKKHHMNKQKDGTTLAYKPHLFTLKRCSKSGVRLICENIWGKKLLFSMNHPQNTKIKSKRYHAIFENFHGKWPTVSPLLTTLMVNLSKQLSNSLSQARLSQTDGFQISL